MSALQRLWPPAHHCVGAAAFDLNAGEGPSWWTSRVHEQIERGADPEARGFNFHLMETELERRLRLCDTGHSQDVNSELRTRRSPTPSNLNKASEKSLELSRPTVRFKTIVD